MNHPVVECPACRVRMQEGVVFYAGNKGALGRGTWVEGQPEKSFVWGYATKGRRQLEVVTLRCPSCGWLISFAPNPAESER